MKRPQAESPLKTMHKYEDSRSRLFGFMRDEIDKGRQVYIVYPLIQESETLGL